MTRVLVTGGFGFLGSHLVELLLNTTDCHVQVVDDLSTSPLPLERLLLELDPKPGRLTWDICTVADYCRRSTGVQLHQIYHLASIVGPAGVIPHIGKIVQSIVDDTYRVMGLAVRHGARFLDVSTSEVYGGGVEGLCSEDMNKIVPPRSSARLEYALAKLAAETAIVNTTTVTDLHACIVRPFNITGPRQSGKGGFVLPRFAWRAMNNQPLTVFGDGTQVRAFTNVRDMACGLKLAMENGRSGEIYNLGNPANKCSILELANAVIRIVGSSSDIVFMDPKIIYGPLYEEANNKFPDSGKAFRDLKWQPLCSRDDTITEAVNYFKSLPENLARLLGGET